MDEVTSFDKTKRQIINPLVDEINRVSEPLLKVAMEEIGFELPLTVRLYNQIRFYEEYGKLKMGTSVASKKTLAEQFGVTEKQITAAYNNLTNRYKLGKWVEHDQPVFRNVKRTWMSNARIKQLEKGSHNYYSVTPELLQRNSTTITAEYLAPEVPPLSESKKKVRENKTTTKVVVAGDPATHTRSLEDLELDQRNESGVVEKTTREYGNADINAAMAYFEERLKLDPKSRWARARAKNLISKHGLEVVKQGIDIAAIAQEDPYGPKVSNMEKLFYKWNDLILYARKKDGEFNSNSGITII